MDSKELAQKVAGIALEKKAEDVIFLHVAPLTSMADYFVICTGETNTHVKAISEHIIHELKQARNRPLHIEGLANQEWVLLDYIDVIVHVFQPKRREFYGLDRLWGDAEKTEVRDEAE